MGTARWSSTTMYVYVITDERRETVEIWSAKNTAIARCRELVGSREEDGVAVNHDTSGVVFEPGNPYRFRKWERRVLHKGRRGE